jgi:hypothetical protein
MAILQQTTAFNPFTLGASYATPAYNPTSGVATQQATSIHDTLQWFLKKTLVSGVQWTHQQRQHLQGIQDTFSAILNDIEIQLQAVRSVVAQHTIPQTVQQWMITLHWKANNQKPRKRIIDGTILNLPDALNPLTDVTQETIAKLFRSAYDQVSNQFSEFIPMILSLATQIQAKTVAFSLTNIKPDFKYGLQGGKLLQVGDKAPRLELFRTGNSVPVVTLYSPQRSPVKLHANSLKSPILQQALSRLLDAVDAIRGKATGLDLSRF